MPQPASEAYSSPDDPPKIHVRLPDGPPEMTESVAAAFLHLLRALVAEPAQACSEAGKRLAGAEPAGSSRLSEVRQTST